MRRLRAELLLGNCRFPRQASVLGIVDIQKRDDYTPPKRVLNRFSSRCTAYRQLLGRGIAMDLFKKSLRVLGMLACMTVVLCSAHAQYRASIQGVVTDPQGSAVSGATLTLKNLDTNQTLTPPPTPRRESTLP